MVIQKGFAILRVDVEHHITFEKFLPIERVVEPPPDVVGDRVEWIAPARDCDKANIHQCKRGGVLACVVSAKGRGLDPANQFFDWLALEVEGLSSVTRNGQAG